jgi:uncharacterized protein DUF4124
MKQLTLALGLLAVPALAPAADVWRWADPQGTMHYSNVIGSVPEKATEVTTQITIEADRLPGDGDTGLRIANGQIVEPAAPVASRTAKTDRRASRWLPDAPRIYDEARLRFGCFAGSVLFSGGFSHPDDITAAYNCLPYRLGPGAWLNAARAELALRENGINPLDVMKIYDEIPKMP